MTPYVRSLVKRVVGCTTYDGHFKIRIVEKQKRLGFLLLLLLLFGQGTYFGLDKCTHLLTIWTLIPTEY